MRGAESNLRPYRDLLHRPVSAMDVGAVQSTKVELMLNLKTAKTFGIAVPLPLLGRVDKVIE